MTQNQAPRDFSVYLVNAGNDPGFASIANDATFPALGVLALGTWLKKRDAGNRSPRA